MHMPNSKVKYINKLYGALQGSSKHLSSCSKLLVSVSTGSHHLILFWYLHLPYLIVRKTARQMFGLNLW